eukprot:TRINITY_DN5463_c0_g1_i1.p1 TRINITY_DN5463_c0_g1~~TRINITY_DN5463_c0_g1_i1.p1  ORF type:complete len:176 (-),score=54.47 TRINITY_DN5463_c0_g1_i1:80-607(-)
MDPAPETQPPAQDNKKEEAQPPQEQPEQQEEVKEDELPPHEDDKLPDELGGDEDVLQTKDSDKRSVFVKNLDLSTNKEDLSEFFKSCGGINRVTIMYGKGKNYAYVEFNEVEAAENAKILDGSILKGRQINVLAKRTNVPRQGRGVMKTHRDFSRFRTRGHYMFHGRRGGGFRPY